MRCLGECLGLGREDNVHLADPDGVLLQREAADPVPLRAACRWLAGVGDSVTDQFDFNASSPAELQGFGCSIGGSAKFGGGVEGNIGLCRGLSAEGGATIGTPELSANASGGYTWVLTSSTGYESKTPAWVRAIYNRLPAYLRNPSPTICDPVISGPDGPSSFGYQAEKHTDNTYSTTAPPARYRTRIPPPYDKVRRRRCCWLPRRQRACLRMQARLRPLVGTSSYQRL
jgi:hypothetical protein